MKSKILFVIILFSLLLNVCHDLLIEHQVNIELTSELDHKKIKKIISKHQHIDLHEIFHFSAVIIVHKNVEIFSKISRDMLFIEKSSPQLIIESSFKPPRA